MQNGEYGLRNNGDLAMLTVTLGRLRRRWPASRIQVLTSSPALLRAYAPGAEPIGDGRLPTVAGLSPVGRLIGWLGPARVGPGAVALLHGRQHAFEPLLDRVRRRAAARRGCAAVAESGAPAGVAVDVDEPSASPTLPNNVAAQLPGASLVLALGGGYLTDVDPGQTLRTLGVLERAIKLGIPTALVGQGIGPLTDPALVAHARRILPEVNLIGLREGLKGPRLLAELGVPGERVTVTGDDAIELAHGLPPREPGADIGICLRVADYSPVAAQAKEVVGRMVRGAAARHDAALVPLIISEFHSEDRRSTMPLVAGYPRVIPPLGRFVPAAAVAARVSRCRVLVTGAYHMAVFALSEGIPVVGLTSSAYYDDKFLGLADMFNGGLQMIHLDDPELDVRLAAMIEGQWEQAPVLRARLRQRAAEQIALGTEFYDRIFRLAGNP